MIRAGLLLLIGASLFAGCTSRPAWKSDPASATLAYWTDQPAEARVVAPDYGPLWDAAENAAERFGFQPATTDYRGGLLTTRPQISPQFFEFWHDEVRTLEDMAESSLATIRRRLRFEFRRSPDGRYVVEPKVIVERLSLPERRITNAVDYRGVLGPGTQQRFGPAAPVGTSSYWYAIGRDADLERALADRIAKRAEGRVIDVRASLQP
jgi:hypothetical protein